MMMMHDATCAASLESCLTNESCQRILNLLRGYLDSLRHERGNLASFWLMYVDVVETLLGLIRADREGDWNLHLASTRKMIPWCFAMEKTNYARYVPVCFALLCFGAAATPGITKDLQSACDKGEEVFKTYMEKLEAGSGFHDPIKKLNLQMFSSLQKSAVIKAGANREVVLKADNRVFGQMLLITQNRKLDIKEVRVSSRTKIMGITKCR